MAKKIAASHILISFDDMAPPGDAASRGEALVEIERLAGEVAGGADFAGLARKHSSCPSARSGGDLGSFGPGMMVEPFNSVAFELEVEQVSGTVETEFGFHLIKRTA